MRTLPLQALVVALGIGACSSGSRQSGPSDSGPSDADADADSDGDADTGTDTGTQPVGWSWLEASSDIDWGEFTDIAGRTGSDVIATGRLTSQIQSDSPFLAWDGSSLVAGSPWPGLVLHGTGVCVSPGGEYYLATTTTYSPDFQPHFYSSQDDGWEEIPLPPDLCQGENWLGIFLAGVLSPRHLACLDSEGFAALLVCRTPPEAPPPGETTTHLVIYDGQDWTVPCSFATDTVDLVGAVWGQAADDLFLFFAGAAAVLGYHFDGAGLTAVTKPPGQWFFWADGGVKAMAGSRAAQGAELGYWVTGTYFDGTLDPGRYRGFVWRSPDGLAWTDVEIPHPADPSMYVEYLHDLWISDQGEVFVVGVRFDCSIDDECPTMIPLLLRFASGEWEEIEVPQHPLFDGEARGELQRIWGTGGVIFVAAVMNLAGSDVPVLLRYQPY